MRRGESALNDLVPAGVDPVLVRLEQARFALAEARDLNDAKQIRDLAKAAADLLKQQRLSQEAVQDALELKLSAERRMGEFLKENVTPGNPQLFRGGTIGRLPEGVSRTQSHRWQKVAGLPEEAFTGYLAECRRKGEEPTTAGAVKLALEAAQGQRREALQARAVEQAAIRGEYPRAAGRSPVALRLHRERQPGACEPLPHHGAGGHLRPG